MLPENIDCIESKIFGSVSCSFTNVFNGSTDVVVNLWCLPVQLVPVALPNDCPVCIPLPLYPLVQEHVYEPTVLVHIPPPLVDTH